MQSRQSPFRRLLQWAAPFAPMAPAGTIAVAWLAFVVSFFLPATDVAAAGTAPGTPLTGWEAFTFAFEGLFAIPFLALAEPRVLWALAFPTINFAMFAAPLVAWLWDRIWPYAILLALFAIVPWQLPHQIRGNLYVGFYLWNGSFVVMALGCGWLSTRRASAPF